MLYQIRNGTVSVGGKEILSHVDFEIKGKEKIAIVGRNGAGKTTLLRLLAGELELDRDDRRMEPGIHTSRTLTIGILHQNPVQDQEKTVEELLMESCSAADPCSRERYAYETEYNRMFTGFGFPADAKKRKLSSFSGGEQTKISLIRLLLQKPDLLLLDEPTNHLDIQTVQWLEGYLKTYEHAAVFVSHDRFFLDQVVEVVYELRDGTLRRYHGNYTQYRQQRQKELILEKKAYERQQQELRRLNELVEKFKHKPRKAAFARSRKKMMERMELLPEPESDDVSLFTGEIQPLMAGSKWVFEAEHLKIGYEQTLLELSLRIRRGQKIGIIGDNGAGKTTFLKIVAGFLAPLGGKCMLGNYVTIGYFDQQSASIESEKTVFEHFTELFPKLTAKEARQVLASYLFRGAAAQTRVSDLSGGEKARLVLAELLYSRPNFLVLDEPTNHMDIQAKETLESAFQSYTGTMLFVSHDRYFIRQVADAILVFDGKSAMYYPFGYEHYLKHSREQQGSGLAAMIQAEDQALIAGMRAVPKAEKHRLREIDTEEAYRDWRFRLASESMEGAAKQARRLWEEYQTAEEKWQRCFAEKDLEETIEILEAEKIQLEKKLEEAWDQWTKCCVEWWEVYDS